MERLVFVHGSLVGGRSTWRGQLPLGERFELLLVERPGFPPNPPVGCVDFERDAELVATLLRPGDHLIGHSYGGVISLLAAASRPDLLRSLTVIEPPASSVALDNPAVATFAARGVELYASAENDDPETFLRRFLAAVGSDFEVPSPLPPELAQGAQALTVERGPWEAEVPLDTLATSAFPTLVVSGAHHAAFDGICDALVRELSAERVVLEGYGHSVQRHPRFNDELADFARRATETST